MIVNAYVLKMCFHIYAYGAQKSWHSGCVSAKTWERACVSSWKYQSGKGTRLCFQLSFTFMLGNAYVLKTCFFLCFLKTEIRCCFSCSSSPEPLFLPETLHISRSKAKETICSGKNRTSQNHITSAKQNYKFYRQEKYKRYNLTYKPVTELSIT